MLIYHSLRGYLVKLFPLHVDLSRILSLKAVHHPGQLGYSGTLQTEDSQNLSLMELQIRRI